jgi:orotidine-5'-phosphate decarboxylase
MVFAVTVLTSIDDYECQKIYGGNVRQTVSHFGMMVVEAGLQGVICSGQDLEVFAEEPGLFDDLYKLTPGVRPTWAPTVGDQKRVVTPRDAIMAGASGIVIGRPVLQPPEGTTIEEAIQLVVREVNQAFEDRGAGPQRAERGAP